MEVLEWGPRSEALEVWFEAVLVVEVWLAVDLVFVVELWLADCLGLRVGSEWRVGEGEHWRWVS